MPDQKQICQKCQKPKGSASHRGSLTGYLFENLNCVCDKPISPPTPPKVSAGFCPTCRMMRAEERAGTFTSYLFQDIRCRCLKPDSKPVPNKDLSTRFRLTPESMARLTVHKTALKSQPGYEFIASIAEFDLSAGETIDDSYELMELIGQGGMGLVFTGRHLELERTCAIKILSPSAISETSWMMFQNEARIIAGLSHPGICPIYDLGIHKGQLPFYAMEYLPGETLEQVLMRQGTISVGAVLEVFAKLADALAYAHSREVIHKDIKPGNIMIMPPSGSEMAVKLLDFGIAELQSKERTDAKPEGTIGTALYMSPERFDNKNVDLRSDLYSIGCSMFEALTGVLPYESDDLEKLIERHKTAEVPLLKSKTDVGFPLEIEAIVRKLLAKKPEERYQSAEDLSVDLKAVLERSPLKFAVKELDELRRLDYRQKDTGVSPLRTGGVTGGITRKHAMLGLLSVLAVVLLVSFSLFRPSYEPSVPRILPDATFPELKDAKHLAGVKIDKNDGIPLIADMMGSRTDHILQKGKAKLFEGWECQIVHPSLKQCKLVITKTKARISKADYEAVICQEVVLKGKKEVSLANFIVVSKTPKVQNNETDALKLKAQEMFSDVSLESPNETFAGMPCKLYAFKNKKTGMKGQFWTTDYFDVDKRLADLYAIYCQVPAGFGLPVKLIYADSQGHTAKPSYALISKMKRTVHISELIFELPRKQGPEPGSPEAELFDPASMKHWLEP